MISQSSEMCALHGTPLTLDKVYPGSKDKKLFAFCEICTKIDNQSYAELLFHVPVPLWSLIYV